MALTTPDNITNPFVLNERFHPCYHEKQQIFKNEIIFAI
ncbi:hypothetical protein BTN50_1230 [Candidatus Enterovibrio altilux]|uniref:Uncharacterized protein n=1 Tax=Candidatus Enterovibrio altilux TaxID=1927128 RepID=A0A291B9M7_9GAMM|nr:hypothetical protein BTN50_1230 [Candidatus Enterovibrio luxaltus]